MRTEDLIRALAADVRPSQPPRRLLPLALLAAGAAAGGAFLLVLGTRPDLLVALQRPGVALKHLVVLFSALAAFGASLRLARPEAPIGVWGWALLVAPVIAVTAFWASAWVTPVEFWPARIAQCLAGIGGLGLPILGATLWALRRGAPARPGVAGAVAGLLAGSTGASVYALYCTEDSPLFWGVWYVLAVAIVAGIGALLGRRLLRW
jgi:hypothetical protein